MLIFEQGARMRVMIGDQSVDVVAYSTVDAKLQASTMLDINPLKWNEIKVLVHKEDLEKAKNPTTV